MHVYGDKEHNILPESTFAGQSLYRQAERVKRLIKKTNSNTILDYGSGKGLQYKTQISVNYHGTTRPMLVSEYWGGAQVTCYDPAYEPYSKMPGSSFDGVICTDVLEHCPEEDLPWIVRDLFIYADRFVFANAASVKAAKNLPNGENAHCTIKPGEWWISLFQECSLKANAIEWELWIVENKKTESGEYKNIEHGVSSFG